jgi:hypothetical protein
MKIMINNPHCIQFIVCYFCPPLGILSEGVPPSISFLRGRDALAPVIGFVQTSRYVTLNFHAKGFNKLNVSNPNATTLSKTHVKSMFRKGACPWAGCSTRAYQVLPNIRPSHLAGVLPPYFNPSFLRKQESMKPSENHERLDSCLCRNDGGMGRTWRRALVKRRSRPKEMARLPNRQRHFCALRSWHGSLTPNAFDPFI